LLRAFLEILLGNGSEYDSDDIDYNTPPRMCYHIDGEVVLEEAPRLTPLHQSPRKRMAYLQEQVNRLRARQVDFEATEVELERQRWDVPW
jgi:hypothetical protein